MKLDDDSIAWQFEAYRWFLENFGGWKEFEKTQLALPIRSHFAGKCPEDIFEEVKVLAQMEEWPCRLEMIQQEQGLEEILRTVPHRMDNSSAAGDFRVSEEEVVIRYAERSARNLPVLISTLAHELAHYLMLTAKTDPPQGWENHEYTTDLCAVFMGFGVFLANTSFEFSQFSDGMMIGWQTSRLGYLGELDLSYGLALYCLLQDIPYVEVKPHLKRNPRSYTKTGMKHLKKKFEAQVEELRSIAQDVGASGGSEAQSR